MAEAAGGAGRAGGVPGKRSVGRPRGPKYPRAVMVMLTEAQGATLEALSWGRKRSMSAVIRHWLDREAQELADRELARQIAAMPEEDHA